MNIRIAQSISCLISLYAATCSISAMEQQALLSPSLLAPPSLDGIAPLERTQQEKHIQITATPPSLASSELGSVALLHQAKHMQANWACDYTITGLYKPTIAYPVVLSASGATLYAGLLNNAIIEWPVEQGVQVKKILIEPQPIKAIALSDNEQILASSACSSSIKLWNTQTKQLLYTLDGHHDTVESLIFNAQSSMLASSDASGEILLWDIITGTLLHRLATHTLPFGKIVFNKSGTMVAATACVSSECTYSTILWDSATGRVLRAFDNNSEISRSIAFHPILPIAAMTSNNYSVAVNDISSGERIALLTGHTSQIVDIAYSHDGSLLASLSIDGTIVIWDMRTGDMRTNSKGCVHFAIPNHHTCIPDQHTEKIYTAIAFSLDDAKIIIHTENRVMNEHTIKIYTLDQKLM